MRWILAVVVLGVAGLTLWLSVPRLVASLLKAPAHFTVLAAHRNQTLTEGELARAIASLEKVRDWEMSADLNSELGFLLLLQAARSEPEERRQEVAARAADFLEQSLLLSASRPHPWVRLAFARWFHGDEALRVTEPLEQSIEIGPYVGAIAIPRLKLLLLIWEHLSPKLKLYTLNQIRYIWPNAGGELLELAKRTSQLWVIRRALRPVPGALQQLDRVLSESEQTS